MSPCSCNCRQTAKLFSVATRLWSLSQKHKKNAKCYDPCCYRYITWRARATRTLRHRVSARSLWNLCERSVSWCWTLCAKTLMVGLPRYPNTPVLLLPHNHRFQQRIYCQEIVSLCRSTGLFLIILTLPLKRQGQRLLSDV